MRTILFVELLGGIGDTLIALSAIQSLSRSHPAAKLTVLTFAPGGELLASDPLIHQVVTAEPKQARRAVENLLAGQSFDLIVSDTNYDGIDRLILNSHARTVTNLWRSPPPNQLVGERFVQILIEEGLIAAAQVAVGQIHLTNGERQQAATIADVAGPVVFLISDAGMKVKQWSIANFVSLGKALQEQFNATIVVPVGANPEQAKQIVDGIGGTAQILPRRSLRDLAAAMSWADLVIAADTGPARIAAAVSVPTITLFGPSWHDRYGQPAPHINLQGYSECPERMIQNFTEQRCWYSGICPLERWNTCLEDISPAGVMVAATALLNATQHPSAF